MIMGNEKDAIVFVRIGVACLSDRSRCTSKSIYSQEGQLNIQLIADPIKR